MSESLSPVEPSDVEAIVTAEPFKVSQGFKLVMWLLVMIGLVYFFLGIIGGDQKKAWMAFQVNLTYWIAVSAAGTGFAAVFHVCNAQWSRPVRRLFQSMSAFFPLTIVLLAFSYMGHANLFSWVHEPAAGKEHWLSSNFLYIRDILGLCLLVFMSKKVVNLEIGRDIAAIRGGLTGVAKEKAERWFHARYDKFVKDGSGDAKADIEKATRKMWVLSPWTILVYALVMTLLAFDQIMSVDPHWYSTLFGALYFMSAVYIAFAFVSIGIGLVRERHPLFRKKFERRTLHDTGKLLFGFGIFWAYMFWSHYLPIWYGNMPEETGWVIVRMREQPWHDVSWFVFGMSFVVPFLLGLSRDVKQTPVLLALTGLIVAVGIWFQQYVLFTPTLYPNEVPIGLTDMFIGLGFFGAFALCCASFLEKMPLMPFGDFYTE